MRLRIGDLAARCGVSRDAVRYYEREGLLPAPSRTGSGHRVYDERAVRRLRFVRNARELGLTLADIRVLLHAAQLKSRHRCAMVAERLRLRAEEIDQQIETLLETRDRLIETLNLCEAEAGDCGVLKKLLEPGPAA